jgi:hypothetical protein
MRLRWAVAAIPATAGLTAAVLAFTPAPAATTATPGPLAACFGNHGVQFGGLNAWLCEVKLGGDPSGALYFTPSADNGVGDVNPDGQMIWYKLHAADSNFYVWENYSQPWGGSAPRANGRIIALDEGPAGQCIVVWPDWSKNPTECFLVTGGGTVVEAPHTMTAQEQASVAEYQKNTRPAIPLEYR